MGVYKKKRIDGTFAWFYDFSFNRRRFRGVGGTTKTQALRVMEKVREKVLSGEYELKKKITNPRIDHFSVTFLSRREHLKSYSRDKLSVELLCAFFKSKHLHEITPNHIEDYISYRRKTVANATINRELACLKRMYSLAIKWGDAKKNPVIEITFLKEPPGRTRFLTKDEITTLVGKSADFFKPVLITALNTGMRHSEIIDLTWDRVHIKNVIDPYIELDITKNGKKRFIPLNDTMIELLNDLAVQKKHDQYVFINSKGRKFQRTTKPFKTALKKAGILDFRFHDLRHTFASYFVMSGGDLLTPKEILGHSSMKMVERYTHLASAHKRKQMNNLGNVFTNCHPIATLTEKSDDHAQANA